jgi:phosphatidylglycerol:prolipoprotein diacylglycerol transferase
VLPFVFLDESKLGPFHAFGLACMLGFFAWDWVVMRYAVEKGLDRSDFRALTVWVLGVGVLFAWAVDGIFYHPPGRSVASSLLAMQGFSTTGGFCGGAFGGLLWRHLWIGREGGRLRVRVRETPAPYLRALDVFVATWPVAWALGRLGCALVHDHPGITVAKGTFASLFAVAWPTGPDDGVHHVLGPLHVVTGGSEARFDLGLIECALLTVMAIAFATTWKKAQRAGSQTILGLLLYGPARFFLDFLRMHDGPAGELRHAGLTFAQYWSLAMVACAVLLLLARPRIAPATA